MKEMKMQSNENIFKRMNKFIIHKILNANSSNVSLLLGCIILLRR
jgi:hypothetical protein